MDRHINYKSGYKYQLVEDYISKTNIHPIISIKTEYIDLSTSGLLFIRKGYAWDGPSGPAIDTLNFMRGSLEHDAFYQLMRMGLLNTKYRSEADDRLYEVCIEDGMCKIRATWVRWAVKTFAVRCASPIEGDRSIITAP